MARHLPSTSMEQPPSLDYLPYIHENVPPQVVMLKPKFIDVVV